MTEMTQEMGGVTDLQHVGKTHCRGNRDRRRMIGSLWGPAGRGHANNSISCLCVLRGGAYPYLSIPACVFRGMHEKNAGV